MSDNFLPEQKKFKKTRVNPAIMKKMLQELIAMFFECFWANFKVSAPAMFMAESKKISYVQG